MGINDMGSGSAAQGGSVEARNIAGRDIIQGVHKEDPAQARAFQYIFEELRVVHNMATKVESNSRAIVQMQEVLQADHERIQGNGRVGIAELARDNAQQVTQLRQVFQDHVYAEAEREHRRDLRTAIGIALGILSPPATIILLTLLGALG